MIFKYLDLYMITIETIIGMIIRLIKIIILLENFMILTITNYGKLIQILNNILI